VCILRPPENPEHNGSAVN